MKKITVVIMLAMLLPLSCAKEKGEERFQTAAEDPAKISVITFISGDVKIAGGKGERGAVTGDRLNSGEVLKTGEKAIAVVQTGLDSVVQVQPGSEFSTEKIEQNEKALTLKKGEVLCKVKKLSVSAAFRLRTNTVVASVRGTVFSVNAASGKKIVAVKEGKVAVNILEQEKAVTEEKVLNAGQQAGLKQKNDKAVFIFVEKIANSEDEKLSEFSDTPIIENVDKKTVTEIETIMNSDGSRTLKREAIIKKHTASLTEIKDAFERLDEITLFSNRVITGIIISHGETYVVITPKGQMNISRKDIKNMRVIR